MAYDCVSFSGQHRLKTGETDNILSIINSMDGKDRVAELMMPRWIEKGQNKLCESKRHSGEAKIDSEPELFEPDLQRKF